MRHLDIRSAQIFLTAGLPAEILAFTARHADIKLDLEEREPPEIVRDIVEGRADVGLGPNLFPDSRLALIPYARYDLAVAMPDGHEPRRHAALKYQDTLGYDHVEQPQSSALTRLLDYAANQTATPKRTRIRIRGFDGVCHMIGLGMGIGIVPLFLAKTYAAPYDLRFVPLTDPWASPQICIMSRSRSSLPFAARAFVEHLEDGRREP